VRAVQPVGPRCECRHDRRALLAGATGHAAASSHELGPPEQRAGKRTTGEVRIGDVCWIGIRVVVVLPDTVIGSGVVVAAGSGVLEPNGLYAGVPAIRKRDLPTGG
jgi:acetyltransferase-like isoleucine patch superfamily enzyme